MISNNLAQARKAACLLFAWGGAVAGIPAGAGIVTPPAAVTVTKSFAYTAYDGGDFVFSTSGTAPGCESGWLQVRCGRRDRCPGRRQFHHRLRRPRAVVVRISERPILSRADRRPYFVGGSR